jgi:hypothetical protein
MSYIILRGRWCDVILLNVHASTEDKIDDMKDRFCEELEHVFYKYPKELSLYRPWRPLVLQEVEAPTFSDIRLTDGGGLSALRAGNFLLIFVRG